MHYERIVEAVFLKRPNRFLAHVLYDGKEEVVHVKNTGRCTELLKPGARVYLQEADSPERKTKWDLIGVKKGERMVNIDSQIPNYAVKEWLEKGHFFENVKLIRPEKTYKNSRFDLYVEYGDKKAFIEVKGVTLEQDGVVKFPDAPSERAVKHLQELTEALKEGYEAYVFFVIQMKDVRHFTPNRNTHPEFADALVRAANAGVHVLAYDCDVTENSIVINKEVPVVLEHEQLYEMIAPLTRWYQENKRDLPWRHHVNAYRVWVSEIMLQQTRVEAVKPFYYRFLEALPTVQDLAQADEDKLLKLWEGLGYYNRVRNMQKAAQQIVEEYGGIFPKTYEEISRLKGIGNYTAGAISSFAFGIPKPAVDGNVLRVVSRVLASDKDIMKQSVRTEVEAALEKVIPADNPSDFNQGLIELGAMICVPNGEPKCEECPIEHLCKAKALGCQNELPVKKKAKERKIENRTVLVFQDGETVAVHKRPGKGLLARMYEFPNLEGHLGMEEVVEYCKSIGLTPVFVKELPKAKHIFSHIEWHMTGYAVRVDELEKNCTENMIFARPEEIQKIYSIPAAFEKYTHYVNIKLGQNKYTTKMPEI